MVIKLNKIISGSCKISTWLGKITIYCDKNDGDVTVPPRYIKQVCDTIKLIKNNSALGMRDYSNTDSRGRKYYRLACLYKANYPNKILRFYSNNILEEDFDDIIELLKGVEINNKVSLNKNDLCNYNLYQLKTILTSMKRRKRVNGEKDNYYINLEV